jgi:hypothetical protein
MVAFSPTAGLTTRSSGEPTACRLAREAVLVIIGLAGQSSHRRLPLSSNVRPHKAHHLVATITPLNLALELHDSEVSASVLDGTSLRIAIALALVHVSENRPGIDSGNVYTQSAEVLIANARVKTPLSSCIGKISDGHMDIEAERFLMLPLPFDKSTAVHLKLIFANGEELEVSGTSIQVTRHGEPKFLEHFSC